KGLHALLAAPRSGDRESDREDPIFEADLNLLEPALQGSSLMPISPVAFPCDPPPDLSQGEHGDVQLLRRRGRDPAGYAHRGLALTSLRHDIGVKQVGHVL